MDPAGSRGSRRQDGRRRPCHLFGARPTSAPPFRARGRKAFVLEDAAPRSTPRWAASASARSRTPPRSRSTPSKNLGAAGDGGLFTTGRLGARRPLLGAARARLDEKALPPRARREEQPDGRDPAAVLRRKWPHLPPGPPPPRPCGPLRRRVRGHPEIRTPKVLAGATARLPPLHVRARGAGRARGHLKARSIGCASTTRSRSTASPVSRAFGRPPARSRTASRRRVVSLPCVPGLTTAEQDTVIEAVRAFYRRRLTRAARSQSVDRRRRERRRNWTSRPPATALSRSTTRGATGARTVLTGPRSCERPARSLPTPSAEPTVDHALTGTPAFSGPVSRVRDRVEGGFRGDRRRLCAGVRLRVRPGSALTVGELCHLEFAVTVPSGAPETRRSPPRSAELLRGRRRRTSRGDGVSVRGALRSGRRSPFLSRTYGPGAWAGPGAGAVRLGPRTRRAPTTARARVTPPRSRYRVARPVRARRTRRREAVGMAADLWRPAGFHAQPTLAAPRRLGRPRPVVPESDFPASRVS